MSDIKCEHEDCILQTPTIEVPAPLSGKDFQGDIFLSALDTVRGAFENEGMSFGQMADCLRFYADWIEGE